MAIPLSLFSMPLLYFTVLAFGTLSYKYLSKLSLSINDS